MPRRAEHLLQEAAAPQRPLLVDRVLGPDTGERLDGNAGFDGDIGRSVLEWLQDAVVRAASFGEDQD